MASRLAAFPMVIRFAIASVIVGERGGFDYRSGPGCAIQSIGVRAGKCKLASIALNEESIASEASHLPRPCV